MTKNKKKKKTSVLNVCQAVSYTTKLLVNYQVTQQLLRGWSREKESHCASMDPAQCLMVIMREQNDVVSQ